MPDVASKNVFWRHPRPSAGAGANVRSAPLVIVQHSGGGFGSDLLLQDPLAYLDLMSHGYAENDVAFPDFYGQDVTAFNLSWAGAAGAAISNSHDLAQWAALLMNDNLLSKQQMQTMILVLRLFNKEKKEIRLI